MPPTRRPTRAVRVLLMLGLLPSALAAAPWHSAAAGSWTRQVPLRGVPAAVPLIQVQCPTIRVCYALGSPGPGRRHSILEATTEAGSTWQIAARIVSFPNPNTGSDGLLALTCPTPSRCFAVGPGGLVMAYRQ